MDIVRSRHFFERPPEVRHAERRCARDRGQLVVVDEHDSSGAQESAEVNQVGEDSVKAVVAVDEGEVEGPFFCEESWQGDLRLFRVELHQLSKPCLVENL